jgi:hypothetical protein
MNPHADDEGKRDQANGDVNFQKKRRSGGLSGSKAAKRPPGSRSKEPKG